MIRKRSAKNKNKMVLKIKQRFKFTFASNIFLLKKNLKSRKLKIC